MRSSIWPSVTRWPFLARLRTEQLAAPAAVTAAFAATTRATVAVIAELNHQIDDLETELAAHFETHPNADIYRSLPGLGVILGGPSKTPPRGWPLSPAAGSNQCGKWVRQADIDDEYAVLGAW